MKARNTEIALCAGAFLCAFAVAFVPDALRARLVFALGAGIGAAGAVWVFLQTRHSGIGNPPLPSELAPVPQEEQNSPADPDSIKANPIEADEIEATEEEPDIFPVSTIDMEALTEALVGSDSPIDLLKMVVGSIRTREAIYRQAQEGLLEVPEGDSIMPAPGDFERTFCRWLEEAGLFTSADEEELPSASMLLPHRSSTFYLRADVRRMPWRSHTRLLAIESALNRILLALDEGADPYLSSETDLYRAAQSATARMCAQAAVVADAADAQSDQGEWAVRERISESIESWRLPMRLSCEFRLNLAGGVAAFELSLPPADAFPSSRFSDGLGRVVHASSQMRRQEQSAFALRGALMLAAAAFDASEQIERVCINAVFESPTRHRCLLSCEFERKIFLEEAQLDQGGDPAEAYRRMGIDLFLPNGVLAECERGFMLDDERFCPPRRYERPELSKRELDADTANILGASALRGLSVDEEARREELMERIMRDLGDTASDNVRAILDMAEKADDPSLREAAMRTVSKIISGTLADESVWGISNEFVEGDELADALAQAVSCFAEQDLDGVIKALEPALAAIESSGTYTDADGIEWRCFRNYAERVLYNRMFALDASSVSLVPASYHAALVVATDACLMLGRVEDALSYAKRALELNPFDERVRLRVARCLEMGGNIEEAADQLRRLLECAYSPSSAGIAYYRLAFQMLQLGQMRLAEACYRKSLEYMSAVIPMVIIELSGVAAGNVLAGHEMDDSEVDEALSEADIACFPTPEVASSIAEGARAALDAEIFPVARALALILGGIVHDDVVHDIIRSIEAEPDR